MSALLPVVEATALAGAAAVVLVQSRRLTATRRALRTDALTGLPNRAALLAELHRHSGTPRLVALLDVNGFKAVNDAYGHESGDTVLAEVGRRLAALPMFAARLGGDEFVAVWSGGRDVADTIRQAISLPIDIGCASVTVTAAIGLTHTVDEPTPVVLRRADLAMYEAKRTGAGVVACNDPLTAVEARPRVRGRDRRRGQHEADRYRAAHRAVSA